MTDRSINKIVVILPKWVGDCVMATPMLRALRSRYPDASITAVSKYVASVLLQPTGLVDEWVTYRGNRNLFSKARKLRKQHFDVAISLPSSLSTGIATWLTGASSRIGYRREGRRVFLTDSLPYDLNDENGVVINEIDRYLTLAGMLGCDTSDRLTELCVTTEDRLLCNRMLEHVGFGQAKKLVVLNSSAAVQPAKRLPDDFMKELCSTLCEDQSVSVLLHCGPGEQKENGKLETAINHPRVRSMGRFEDLPIGLSLAVMERADAVVSTDSGPRHMAAALGRPLISIYGPTDPMKTRQSNCVESIIEADLPCRPCWADTCPLGHLRCLKDLSAANVARVIVGRLEPAASRAA